ncbi:twin-arginine translocase subunit TatC [Tabrizicola sp.]|uniref:twin-arginine translocase subunit TatC n=1 Tax=Tabrizicola sp. TaxID=2005166 RepID=UPI003F3897E8
MTKDEIEDSSAPLVEHLIELRNRLIWSIAAFVVAMIAAFPFAKSILGYLLKPIEEAMRDLGNTNPVMQYTAPQELLFTYFHISVVAGLALSFPVIAYQLWRFVAPGLYRSEKQAFLPFLIASPVLFFAGAAFAQYIVTPLAMAFFLGFADLPSMVSAALLQLQGLPVENAAGATSSEGIAIVFQGKVDQSLDISLKLIMAFGLCFQMPVLLTLMGKAGLATSAGLSNMRRYAIVIMLLVSAIVTPPDLVSMLTLFAAIYPLYEVSIFLIRQMEKRREAELRAEGLWDDEDDAAKDAPEPKA